MEKASGIIPSIGNNDELDFLRLLLVDKLYNFKDNPKDKDALEDLLTGIETTEMFHPTLPASGAFSNVRNNFRDAKELVERGYFGRSLIPASKTILSALASPVTEPIRLLHRIYYGYNPSYMTVEEMRNEKDPDKLYNAADEHINDLFREREDPAHYSLPDDDQLSREEYVQRHLPYAGFDLDDLVDLDDLDDVVEEDADMKKESSANIIGLLKAASSSERVNEAVAKGKQALDSYDADPSVENKKALLEALQNAYITEQPTKLSHFGFLGLSEDDLASTNLQLQRGNTVRSLFRSMLSTPSNLLTSVANAPLRLLGRAVDPNVNLSSYNLTDIENEVDPEKIHKGAEEILKLREIDKANPNDYFEHTKNYLNRYKVSIPEAISMLPTGLVGLANDLVSMPGALYHSIVEGDTTDKDKEIDESTEKRLRKLIEYEKKNRK